MDLSDWLSILSSEPHLWNWVRASFVEAMAWFGVMVFLPIVYAMVPNI